MIYQMTAAVVVELVRLEQLQVQVRLVQAARELQVQ
jgi:hypothetical protein